MNRTKWIGWPLSFSLSMFVACSSDQSSNSDGLPEDGMIDDVGRVEGDVQGGKGRRVQCNHFSAVEANLWKEGSEIKSDMGPRNAGHSGIVCRGKAKTSFDSGMEKYWYVAPSDLLMAQLTWRGEHAGTCQRNPHGGEPSCEQYWPLCGRKLRIQCSKYCRYNQDSLMGLAVDEKLSDSDVHNLMGYSNKDKGGISDLYAQIARETYNSIRHLGPQRARQIPKYVVVVINDYCPRLHSKNSSQCQGVQADLGPGPWLSLIPRAFVDDNQWLHPDRMTEMAFQVEFADDGEALGPHY